MTTWLESLQNVLAVYVDLLLLLFLTPSTTLHVEYALLVPSFQLPSLLGLKNTPTASL